MLSIGALAIAAIIFIMCIIRKSNNRTVAVLLVLSTLGQAPIAVSQSFNEIDTCIVLIKKYKEAQDKKAFSQEELKRILICIELSEKTKNKPPQTIFRQS